MFRAETRRTAYALFRSCLNNFLKNFKIIIMLDYKSVQENRTFNFQHQVPNTFRTVAQYAPVCTKSGPTRVSLTKKTCHCNNWALFLNREALTKNGLLK